jgi:5-methylcytosine-specific restriction endonuclease McrA
MRIFKRDGFKCQHCGLDASSDFDKWYYAKLNVDHVDPKGGDDDARLVTACRSCNSIKWAHPCKTVDEVRALVSEERQETLDWFHKNVKAP